MEKSTAASADFCFVHFTDTHIMAGGVHPPTQVDTAACLQQVIGVLNALEPRPAFAVIGGDLVSPSLLDRSKALTPEDYAPSYLLFQDLLRPLQSPVYMLLGNNDNRHAFHRVMQTAAAPPDAPYHYGFDHQGYHFVLLDSHQPGQSWGRIDAAQLTWLHEDLTAHRGQPTFVFLHHQPWPLGIPWMDALGLQNGEELVNVLRQYPEVRWMICGHVHMDHMVQREGLTMLTTPSTCYQARKLTQERKKPLAGPPGFRLIWVKGAEVSTRVIHLQGEEVASLS
jgi:3',5'-cyclic AMP phosphodiesterase CpdA